MEFATFAPGRRQDFERVDFDQMYAPEEMQDYTLDGNVPVLENLPISTTNAKGTGAGDPLNIVVVGRREDVALAFARQSWDLTEVLSFGNVFNLIGAFLFNITWETSPISPLYVFDRRQDVALPAGCWRSGKNLLLIVRGLRYPVVAPPR